MPIREEDEDDDDDNDDDTCGFDNLSNLMFCFYKERCPHVYHFLIIPY